MKLIAFIIVVAYFAWVQFYDLSTRIEVTYEKSDSTLIVNLRRGKVQIDSFNIYSKEGKCKKQLCSVISHQILNDTIRVKLFPCPSPGRVYFQLYSKGIVYENHTKKKIDLGKEGCFVELY